jgi:hypothetical protein
MPFQYVCLYGFAGPCHPFQQRTIAYINPKLNLDLLSKFGNLALEILYKRLLVSLRKPREIYTHTHTHIYIYIYIYNNTSFILQESLVVTNQYALD